MYKLFTFIILLQFFTAAFAVDGADNYATLSKLPPEKLMDEGREYFEKRQAALALSRFLLVADRLQTTSDPEGQQLCVRALNNAGCVYKYFYFDYPMAYEYLNRAYEMCKEIGYDSFLPVIIVNLGDLYCDYGLTYDSHDMLLEAENLFQECFNDAIKNKDWELLTTAFFNLSNLKYDIDLSQYKGIFSKDIPSDTPDIRYVRLLYEGIKNIQEGNYAAARDCFNRQLDAINTPWEARRDSICTYINIAETYKREGAGAKQTHYLLMALELAQSAEILDIETDIAKQLADYYLHAGDSAEYDKYHTLYLEKREEMNNARLANIGELKYISNLRNEEAKVQTATTRNRYLRLIAIALGCGLLLILISAATIWREYRALKARNQTLFDKYQLLLGSESERREEKYVRSNLDDSKKTELIARINEVMGEAQHICRDDFTSKELAQLVDSNTTYVSQVINEKFGISFSTLLRNSRIKIACHRINHDPQYDNLTLEALANSVGFKSRTAFINAFKREVGLTPSQYIKMANAKREKEQNPG